MIKKITLCAGALAAAATLSVPAAAAELPSPVVQTTLQSQLPIPNFAMTQSFFDDDDDDDDDDRRRRWRGRDDRGYYSRGRDRYPRYTPRRGYGERASYNTRVWRGDDGRHYCRRSDGTTGLLVGGAAGALLGRELAKNGDRTLGTILGAAGGALLGREVEKRVVRCR